MNTRRSENVLTTARAEVRASTRTHARALAMSLLTARAHSKAGRWVRVELQTMIHHVMPDLCTTAKCAQDGRARVDGFTDDTLLVCI